MSDDRSYSADELRRILTLAAEYDQKSSDALSEAELRQIASDLSITEAALDRALQSVRTAGVGVAPSPRRRDLTRVALLGAGATAGLLAFSAPLVVAVSTIETCSLLIAMSCRGGTRAYRRFWTFNAALWTGVAAGPLALAEAPSIVLPLLAWLASSTLGAAAMWIRNSLVGPDVHTPSDEGVRSEAVPPTPLRRFWKLLVGGSHVEMRLNPNGNENREHRVESVA